MERIETPLQKEYFLSVGSYRSLQNVSLAGLQLEFLALIPWQFLSHGELRCNHTSYLMEIANCVAILPPASELWRDGHQLDISITEQVRPGLYEVRCDIATLQLRPGPKDKTSVQLAQERLEAGSTTTMSASKRSRIGQRTFGKTLLERDKECIVTGSVPKRCQAWHIVGFTLGETFLNKILPADHTYLDSYAPENGLFLDSGVHHPFDSYEWGIYVETSGVYRLHLFALDTFKIADHGKRILLHERSRASGIAPPSDHLLRWHYAPCCMKMLRGYGVPGGSLVV